MQITVAPEDGGRLIELSANGRNYIWNNKRTAHLKRYYAANYDNLSAGGVEEAFPSVFADSVNGDEFPFFGEVWSAPWRVEDMSESHVQMSCYSSIYPVLVRKTYEISGTQCACRYALQNEGPREAPCLFGVHPSFAIREGDVLSLPAQAYTFGTVVTDGPDIKPGDSFTWPSFAARNLTRMPESGNKGECIEFHTDKLEDGFIGLQSAAGGGVRLSFDHKLFTSMCIWQIFGGWRGHYALMAEFFSGWPLVLSEALKAKNCLVIRPGKAVATTVAYEVY